jgi:nicotinamide-nucleotide amidase
VIQLNHSTEEYLIKYLTDHGLTVTTVESCTGGMVAAALTSVAGSSRVFQRGFVTYCDEAKHEMVGVRSDTLARHTAVSRETAEEMANGGAAAAHADCCISVTGYAGPDSGSGEPVGLVYIGCRTPKGTVVQEHHFTGCRQEIRQQAMEQALLLLKNSI